MKLNIFLIGTIFITIFIIVPLFILIFTKNSPKIRKISISFISCLYFIILAIGTVSKIENHFPFITFSFNFSYGWFSLFFLVFNFSLINIIINFFMFLPLGIIIFTFVKTNVLTKSILISFCLSIFIEILQFILPIYRNSEIGDIVINSLSGLISTYFCVILNKMDII